MNFITSTTNSSFKYSKRWARRVVALAERDGGLHCQLCKLEFAHINDISLDHIKPKSKGGKKGMYNLQLAHTKCNVAKGNDETPKSPEWFIDHKCRNEKKMRRLLNTMVKRELLSMGLVKVTAEDFHTNYVSKLWNELATNGVTNLSLNMLEEYFEKHVAVRINLLGLKPELK